MQVLQEVFIPEKPTFTPNTRGWDHRAPPAAEEGVPQGTSPADAAAAAAGVLPAFAAEGGSEAAGQSRVAEFHAAYRSGRVTPVQVAEAVIAALAESEAQVGCWLGGWALTQSRRGRPCLTYLRLCVSAHRGRPKEC